MTVGHLLQGIDGVVFDLDGTLIDSEKAICAAASLAFGDLGSDVDEAAVTTSVQAMADDVARYVPGYRLVKPPVFERVSFAPPGETPMAATKVTVFLEVEGAGHWLPKYAGNLDIMTSAALRVGESVT